MSPNYNFNGDLQVLLSQLASAPQALREPYVVLRKLQQTFNRLPALRERIAVPANDEERKVASEISTKVSGLVGSYMHEQYFNEILTSGHICVARLKKMHGIDCFSSPDGDFREFLEDLKHISAVEKKLLLTNQIYFKRVFGFMDQANQSQVVSAIKAQEDQALISIAEQSR